MKVLQIARDSVYSRGGNNGNEGETVDYCHQHNLVDEAAAGQQRPFGIRVSLPVNDTLRNVLGDDWEQLHWFPSEAERDTAFEKMAARHGYYRNTDTPTQVLEKLTRE